MKEKIINALNNETGGPNVETLIGLGVSLGVLVGIFAVIAATNKAIHAMSKVVTYYT